MGPVSNLYIHLCFYGASLRRKVLGSLHGSGRLAPLMELWGVAHTELKCI